MPPVVLPIEFLEDRRWDIDPESVGFLLLGVSVKVGIEDQGLPMHEIQFLCFGKRRNCHIVIQFPRFHVDTTKDSLDMENGDELTVVPKEPSKSLN